MNDPRNPSRFNVVARALRSAGRKAAGVAAADCLAAHCIRVAVFSHGDGMDGNGTLSVTGGTVLVSGPSSSDNSAIDAGISASIDGGAVIAVGSMGMDGGFSSGTQAFATSSVSGSAGQEIVQYGSDGSEAARFAPVSDYQTITVSAPGYAEGDSVSVSVGSQTLALSASTSAATSAGAGRMGGGMQTQGRTGAFQSAASV